MEKLDCIAIVSLLIYRYENINILFFNQLDVYIFAKLYYLNFCWDGLPT